MVQKADETQTVGNKAMNINTDEEAQAVIQALNKWFTDQDIDPATAGTVMMCLIARLLVGRSHVREWLDEAIDAHMTVLDLEVLRILDHVKRK